MARILTEETSLTRKRDALIHESEILKRIVRYEWIACAGLVLAGVGVVLVRGSYTILVIGVIAGVFAFAHRFRIRENQREEKSVQAGLRGEADVTRIFSRALDNTHYLFNDLLIRDGRATAQIDHLVVSPRGIFVVETKNWRGHIEGDARADRWSQTRQPGDAPISVHNPILQAQRQADFVKSFLSRVKVNGPAVHALVIIRSPRTTFRVLNADMPVLRPEEAARFISEFMPSAACSDADVDAVVSQMMRGT